MYPLFNSSTGFMLKSILISMRPHQWYKNLVIFVGIVFSKNLFSPGMWLDVILAFLVFCMLSGSIYIINDIRDVEKDRLHPKKKYRPIAAGILSPKIALIISIPMMVISLFIAFIININLVYTCLVYILINILYTIYLKNFALVDAMVIGIGFVIRAIAGCVAIDVIVSPWLVLCVFLLALVLVFGKRRQELIVAEYSRNCLSHYTGKMHGAPNVFIPFPNIIPFIGVALEGVIRYRKPQTRNSINNL